VNGTERLPCATTKYTYVDELPVTRNSERDLSDLAATDPVEFEIVSPLCLKFVTFVPWGDPWLLQGLLVNNDDYRENLYRLMKDSAENLLLLSELPWPEDDGSLYGKACTTNTDAVFREGDKVGLKFTLVEREPSCGDLGIYPWDLGNTCSGYKDTPPSPDHPIAIRVADGVSGTEASGDYPDENTNTFTHTMTAGAPNPFAPFSHELSVEFTRAYDDAEILFVRHALVVGVIPEEVPQVWTVATNPTLIFSIIRDPPGGASTATLVEGSTISTSMAIDGSHAAQLEDSFNAGVSVGAGVQVKIVNGIGVAIENNVVTAGGGAGFSYAQTPTDVTVSRSSSRHFDIGISFGVGISTSDSPYIAGQPSDVIIGGGANLRFISSIEIFAVAPVVIVSQLVLDNVPSDVDNSALRTVVATALVEKINLVESTSDVLSFDVDADTFTTVVFSVRVPAATTADDFATKLSVAVTDTAKSMSDSLATAASDAGFAPAPTCPAGENTQTILKDATKIDEPWLCLGGLTMKQFLPEQVSTWVMSVYEIEKTIERIGAALTDPNTKMENKDSSSNYDPRADLVKQIENWRTVLANYRAATVKDQAESVAAQLERELNSIHANFQSFLKDTTTGVNHKIYGMARSTTAYGDFLRHGLGKLAEWKLIYHGNFENLGVPEFDGASKEADKETEVCG
jgi:hypothetical protein